MIRDRWYYEAFDVEKAVALIPAERAARLRSEAFGDVICWIIGRCDAGVAIACDVLRRYLGSPDRIKATDSGEIWEYDWIGRHGPDEYFSSTPFLIVEGVVVGLA